MGGIGPAATAHAFQRLIGIAQVEYGAEQDTDFPDVVTVSVPVKGTSEQGVHGDIGSQLGVRSLIAKHGVSVIYAPCNSLVRSSGHIEGSAVYEVGLISEAAKYVSELRVTDVTTLTSRTTRDQRSYERAYRDQGMTNEAAMLDEEQQARVDRMILAAMGGRDLDAAREELSDMCQSFLLDSDYVVLGCTELSLLAGQTDIMKDRVIDAQEIALRETLRKAT